MLRTQTQPAPTSILLSSRLPNRLRLHISQSSGFRGYYFVSPSLSEGSSFWGEVRSGWTWEKRSVMLGNTVLMLNTHTHTEHSSTVIEISSDDKRGSVGLPNIVSEQGNNERKNSEVACEEIPPPLGSPLIVRPVVFEQWRSWLTPVSRLISQHQVELLEGWRVLTLATA